jgi:hypothetical protein
MEYRETIVIGGGFSGLYASHKLGATVITPKESFDSKSSYIFLKYRPQIRLLLKELEIVTDKKEFKIGYLHNDRIYASTSKEMIENYIKKAYGVIPTDTPFIGYETNSYYICTASYSVVCSKMEEEAEKKNLLINGKVISIDIANHILGVAIGDSIYKYRYKYLINTLPLPLFFMLCTPEIHLTEELRATPIFVYKTTNVFILPEKKEDYSQILDMRENSSTMRWVKGETGWTEETITEYPEMVDGVKIRYGKIARGKEVFVSQLKSIYESIGIFNLGRFAEWRGHYDSEDSVDRVSEIEKSIKEMKINEAKNWG